MTGMKFIALCGMFTCGFECLGDHERAFGPDWMWTIFGIVWLVTAVDFAIRYEVRGK